MKEDAQTCTTLLAVIAYVYLKRPALAGAAGWLNPPACDPSGWLLLCYCVLQLNLHSVLVSLTAFQQERPVQAGRLTFLDCLDTLIERASSVRTETKTENHGHRRG